MQGRLVEDASISRKSLSAEVLDLLVRALHFIFPGCAFLSCTWAGGLWDRDPSLNYGVNFRLYSGSPKVGPPIASILKGNGKGIPALFGLNRVSNFMEFTVHLIKVPSIVQRSCSSQWFWIGVSE